MSEEKLQKRVRCIDERQLKTYNHVSQRSSRAFDWHSFLAHTSHVTVPSPGIAVEDLGVLRSNILPGQMKMKNFSVHLTQPKLLVLHFLNLASLE